MSIKLITRRYEQSGCHFSLDYQNKAKFDCLYQATLITGGVHSLSDIAYSLRFTTIRVIQVLKCASPLGVTFDNQGWASFQSSVARKYCRNGHQAGRRRHFERRLTIVDPRTQFRIRAADEENLDGKRITRGNGHVERRVVIDSALVRVRAKP
jgi:hypothetical protein